ncbi:MAG: UDP-N-acetylmuramate--L-alanine ligase [Brumimicrobium sp.]|nr:UDP-N-acetylmuramate--L-alanine ligase [Brumimicrobium sp.]
MKYDNYTHIYFVGIGGIGMSALARYFNHFHYRVAGYDKTETELTKNLVREGIHIHYSDKGDSISQFIAPPENTLVILTPAVPSDLGELQFLRKHNYTIQKRAEVLGRITEAYKTLAVAGTHGKTTTSTMLAHVLHTSAYKCNAFLGGISSNFDSNLLIDPTSNWMVVEADEYDRSFLKLSPFSTIITSTEADHLDIYHEPQALVDTFNEYGHLVNKDGFVIKHFSLSICQDIPSYTYGIGENPDIDYRGSNIRIENNEFVMDVTTPTANYPHVIIGMPGIHNAENALAVIALCDTIGLTVDDIREALHQFRGVHRRFELHIKKEGLIYIDDYAHHPTAIQNLLKSIHLIYKGWPVYLIFQPHLYSRTQDFMHEFAEALSEAENVILMPIYPARELPIEGITSEELAKMVTSNVQVLNMQEVPEFIKTIQKGVILTVGAGDISLLIQPIKKILA